MANLNVTAADLIAVNPQYALATEELQSKVLAWVNEHGDNSPQQYYPKDKGVQWCMDRWETDIAANVSFQSMIKEGKVRSTFEFLIAGTEGHEGDESWSEDCQVYNRDFLVTKDIINLLEEFDQFDDADRRRIWAFVSLHDLRLQDMQDIHYADGIINFGSQEWNVETFQEAEDRAYLIVEDYANELMDTIFKDYPSLRHYFNVSRYINEIIQYDGRGSQLASYDGEEHESEGYYLYRIN